MHHDWSLNEDCLEDVNDPCSTANLKSKLEGRTTITHPPTHPPTHTHTHMDTQRSLARQGTGTDTPHECLGGGGGRGGEEDNKQWVNCAGTTCKVMTWYAFLLTSLLLHLILFPSSFKPLLRKGRGRSLHCPLFFLSPFFKLSTSLSAACCLY